MVRLYLLVFFVFFCFWLILFFFFFQAEDGIRDTSVTGVQTCALPILREEVFERRSILPCAVAGSPAKAGCAAAAFAPTGGLDPDRDGGALELRRGIGVVNSVASRSMSTFTLSVRCGGVACADAGAAAGIDAAGGGAACGAGASRAGAGSERGDATAAGAAVLARADSKARSVTIGCGGVSCQTSHATQPTAKSIAIAMVRQKKSEASMRSDTGRMCRDRPPAGAVLAPWAAWRLSRSRSILLMRLIAGSSSRCWKTLRRRAQATARRATGRTRPACRRPPHARVARSLFASLRRKRASSPCWREY